MGGYGHKRTNEWLNFTKKETLFIWICSESQKPRTLFLEVSCDLPLYKSREALKSFQNLSVLNEGRGKSISPQNVFHILFGMGMVLRLKFLEKNFYFGCMFYRIIGPSQKISNYEECQINGFNNYINSILGGLSTDFTDYVNCGTVM